MIKKNRPKRRTDDVAQIFIVTRLQCIVLFCPLHTASATLSCLYTIRYAPSVVLVMWRVTDSVRTTTGMDAMCWRTFLQKQDKNEVRK